MGCAKLSKGKPSAMMVSTGFDHASAGQLDLKVAYTIDFKSEDFI
jgi:hypothetical protein